MTRVERSGLWTVLVLVSFVGALFGRGCWLQPVEAQSRTGNVWKRTKAQGALLARIIVSERSAVLRGSDYDPAELDLFASVVINNRDRFANAHGWIDVMGRLSPHVALLEPPTRPRQEWTSTLHGCTEAKPGGWVDERDGDWRIYSLAWQSFCLDVRDRWVADQWQHADGVVAWGNIADSKRQLCRKVKRLCLVQHFADGNLFFGRAGDPACNLAAQESFVEAHCEGRP